MSSAKNVLFAKVETFVRVFYYIYNTFMYKNNKLHAIYIHMLLHIHYFFLFEENYYNYKLLNFVFIVNIYID